MAAGGAHSLAGVSEPEDDDAMPPGTRRCIVTRDCRPQAELVRFVLDPQGQVVPDVDRRLPGRGFWLSPARDVVEMAARKNLFARAARRAVTVPADLAGQVERLLARRCLDTLGLARRAGQAVTGFEKVRDRLRAAAKGDVPAVLVTARDGGSDGRGKISALAAAVCGPRTPPLVVGFDAEDLGRPLGRDRAVHVAVDRGRLAGIFLESSALLAGFRPGPMILGVADVLEASRRGPPDATDPDAPTRDQDRPDPCET